MNESVIITYYVSHDPVPTWTKTPSLEMCVPPRFCMSGPECLCASVFTCQQSSPTNHPLRMWVGLPASVRHHTHGHTHTHFDVCHPLLKDQAAIYMVQYLHNLPSHRIQAQALVSYGCVRKLSILLIPFTHCIAYTEVYSRCTPFLWLTAALFIAHKWTNTHTQWASILSSV